MECCSECGADCPRVQARWTPGEIEVYEDQPIPYELAEVETADVELGLRAPHVRWEWRPYAERPADHREDFDRLLVSIYHDGVRAPVIGWRHPETGKVHVLIGQRRAEIAKRLGIGTLRALLICEDVRRYWSHDLQRINRHLKPVAGEVSY